MKFKQKKKKKKTHNASCRLLQFHKFLSIKEEAMSGKGNTNPNYPSTTGNPSGGGRGNTPKKVNKPRGAHRIYRAQILCDTKIHRIAQILQSHPIKD